MGKVRNLSVHVLCDATLLTAFTGDYLYRDQASFQFDGGLWGLLRVTP